MKTTEFFEDFKAYYHKAKILQDRNILLLPPETTVNDPLMDSVTIYDTVNRKYAGFSKALEDIHGVRMRKDLIKYGNYSGALSIGVFHYIHLFHRFTGSGASFQPRILPDGSLNPKEHGYCNNKVEYIAHASTQVPQGQEFDSMRAFIVGNLEPMVTSVGNQPPSLKNPDPSKYRLAQQYYFDQVAQQFVHGYLNHIMLYKSTNGKPMGIKEAVDFSCEWHKLRGFKQWHFVLTAFVMDTAEYYPDLIDPQSHCYYGANCIRAFDLMFTREKTDKEKGNNYYEKCMSAVLAEVKGLPYDVEDVCCDYIRYIVEYIPKGYQELRPDQKLNNSTLKVDGDYPPHIQARITAVTT
jgi:hypothetical protein